MKGKVVISKIIWDKEGYWNLEVLKLVFRNNN